MILLPLGDLRQSVVLVVVLLRVRRVDLAPVLRWLQTLVHRCYFPGLDALAFEHYFGPVGSGVHCAGLLHVFEGESVIFNFGMVCDDVAHASVACLAVEVQGFVERWILIVVGVRGHAADRPALVLDAKVVRLVPHLLVEDRVPCHVLTYLSLGQRSRRKWFNAARPWNALTQIAAVVLPLNLIYILYLARIVHNLRIALVYRLLAGIHGLILRAHLCILSVSFLDVFDHGLLEKFVFSHLVRPYHLLLLLAKGRQRAVPVVDDGRLQRGRDLRVDGCCAMVLVVAAASTRLLDLLVLLVEYRRISVVNRVRVPIIDRAGHHSVAQRHARLARQGVRRRLLLLIRYGLPILRLYHLLLVL